MVSGATDLLGGAPGAEMSSSQGHEVPTWNGGPSSFENFATACKWVSTSLRPIFGSLRAYVKDFTDTCV